jgi:hypothetical protein
MPGTNGLDGHCFSCGLPACAQLSVAKHSPKKPLTCHRVSCCWPKLFALAQTYASSQPGLRLEAHRRSPAFLPHSQLSRLCKVRDWGLNGPLQLDHRINWRKTSRRDWSVTARQGGLPSCSCTRIRGRPPAYPPFFTGDGVTARVCFSSAASLRVRVCVIVKALGRTAATRRHGDDDNTTRRKQRSTLQTLHPRLARARAPVGDH